VRLRPILGLVALAAVSIACGGNGEGNASTTSSPPDVTTTLAPTTTDVVTLSDLTGRWENESIVLEVNSGGEYVLRAPDDQAAALMGGFVARDDDRFSFVTGTTGECPGQTGTYVVEIDGDMLTLTLVDDPCESRSAALVEPLTLSE
jgi:hypothetical protein